MKKLINNKFVQSAAVLLASTGAALASTSGGTLFQPISGGLTEVMDGLEGLGGFIIAGGVILGGYSVVKGPSEHKGGMMAAVGAIIGGIAATHATSIASAVSGSATIGHSPLFTMMLAHLPILPLM